MPSINTFWGGGFTAIQEAYLSRVAAFGANGNQDGGDVEKDYSSYTDPAGNVYSAKKVGDLWISQNYYAYDDPNVTSFAVSGWTEAEEKSTRIEYTPMAPDYAGRLYNCDAIGKLKLPSGWRVLTTADLIKIGVRYVSPSGNESNHVTVEEYISNGCWMYDKSGSKKYGTLSLLDKDLHTASGAPDTVNQFGIISSPKPGRVSGSTTEATYIGSQENIWVDGKADNGNQLYLLNYSDQYTFINTRGNASGYAYSIVLVHDV